MMVFTGDWLKTKEWKQVVTVNVGDDTFATLDADGELVWWDTETDYEMFLDHKSNTEMQSLLRHAGI